MNKQKKSTNTLAKIKERYQITLPKLIRQKFNITEGDFVNIKEKDGGIFLQPVKMISSNQEYFYTKEWQVAEAEADKDIAEGNVAGPFKTVDELFEDLDN
jgi:AbrB family looped-hinge helix DNA binding protein